MALGLLMMKTRAGALPEARAGSLLRALAAWMRDPVWLAALAIQATGYALYIVALADAPVSMVAVMMQGGIALFVVFAATFLHERAVRPGNGPGSPESSPRGRCWRCRSKAGPPKRRRTCRASSRSPPSPC